MATTDWNEKGHDYAYNWTKDSKLPEFPDDRAKADFNDGCETGWFDRGKDDSRRNSQRLKDFPNSKAASDYNDGYREQISDWEDDSSDFDD